MNNDPEVSTELHRLADAEPLTDFDTNAVLTRGAAACVAAGSSAPAAGSPASPPSPSPPP